MEPFRMTPPFRPRADISTEDVDARSHISRYRLLIHLSIQPPSRREARSPLRTMYVETLVFATYFLFIRSFALTDCDDRSHWGPMVEGGESDIPCRHYQPHFFLFYGYPFFFFKYSSLRTHPVRSPPRSLPRVLHVHFVSSYSSPFQTL